MTASEEVTEGHRAALAKAGYTPVLRWLRAQDVNGVLCTQEEALRRMEWEERRHARQVLRGTATRGAK